MRRRTDYNAAMAEFRWPRLPRFNWAIDWFDEYARGNTRTALRIGHDGGDKIRRVQLRALEKESRAAGQRGEVVAEARRKMLVANRRLPSHSRGAAPRGRDGT